MNNLSSKFRFGLGLGFFALLGENSANSFASCLNSVV